MKMTSEVNDYNLDNTQVGDEMKSIDILRDLALLSN